jgi:hypothetical protein
VFATSYFDAESNQTYDPVNKAKALGDNYFGSEVGYIINNKADYLKFGGGYWEV